MKFPKGSYYVVLKVMLIESYLRNKSREGEPIIFIKF